MAGPSRIRSQDGKTSRQSHDRALDNGKSNDLSVVPILWERLAEGGGLKGALVSDRRVGTNAKIAQAIKDAGAG
jgi:hypothetical protein